MQLAWEIGSTVQRDFFPAPPSMWLVAETPYFPEMLSSASSGPDFAGFPSENILTPARADVSRTVTKAVFIGQGQDASGSTFTALPIRRTIRDSPSARLPAPRREGQAKHGEG